jgi:two-component system nitrate/nitrite response regulator NarL
MLRCHGQGQQKGDRLTILVCDDHPLVRAALAASLAGLVAGHAVRTARDFDEAWAAAEDEDEIILCVVDLHMPGAEPQAGLAGVKARAPEAKFIVVTGSESDADLHAALALGVDGFVPKTAEPGVIEAAIRLVMAGGRYLPPRVAELVAGNAELASKGKEPAPARPPPDRTAIQALYGRITDRQRDVLRLLAQGRSNKEIANTLVLSPATVKTHVASIIAVLGARNRTEAAAHARASGLVD